MLNADELRAMRAEFLETKERLWAELNQTTGALALLDHLIEQDGQGDPGQGDPTPTTEE